LFGLGIDKAVGETQIVCDRSKKKLKIIQLLKYPALLFNK